MNSVLVATRHIVRFMFHGSAAAARSIGAETEYAENDSLGRGMVRGSNNTSDCKFEANQIITKEWKETYRFDRNRSLIAANPDMLPFCVFERSA